jgi:16S rRNA (uracil1498-N3)-methyltransferase
MLPFFYHIHIPQPPGLLSLDEPTSKHCVQVLRMSEGAELMLCDGKGKSAKAAITRPDRKKCQVKLLSATISKPRTVKLALGIAFTKSKSRNEWFLEKATELGIEHIYPLIVERSEKEKYNADRYQQILISAMLQSQQVFLPSLHPPQKLSSLMDALDADFSGQRFIAHCVESERSAYLEALEPGRDSMMLIGPEGDFSDKEIDYCLNHHFVPVRFGANRLRTETAGLYACSVFNAFHYG